MVLGKLAEPRQRRILIFAQGLRAHRLATGVQERDVFGRAAMLFDGGKREELAALGEVRTPSVADLFVAMMSPPNGGSIGAQKEAA